MEGVITVKYSENPNERTVRRAKKEPRKSMSMSLYAAATSQTPPKTMEEMLGLPLYFSGVRIDGYIEIGDTIYAYCKDIPAIPKMRSLYAYLLEVDGNVFPHVAPHVQKKYIKKFLGICVMEIKLLPSTHFGFPQQIKDENEIPHIVDFEENYKKSEEA